MTRTWIMISLLPWPESWISFQRMSLWGFSCPRNQLSFPFTVFNTLGSITFTNNLEEYLKKLCIAHMIKQMRSWSLQSLQTVKLFQGCPPDAAALGFLPACLPHCGPLCPTEICGRESEWFGWTPNLLLLSYSIWQRKHVKKALSLGHPKGRGSTSMKESRVPLFYSNTGSCLMHAYHSTRGLAHNQKNPAKNGVTMTIVWGAFECRLGQNVKPPLFQLEMSLEIFPQTPHWPDMVSDCELPMPPTSAKMPSIRSYVLGWGGVCCLRFIKSSSVSNIVMSLFTKEYHRFPSTLCWLQ